MPKFDRNRADNPLMHIDIREADRALYGDVDLPDNTNAMVVHQGKDISIGNIITTPTGLQFDGDISEIEWQDFGKTLIQINTAYQWIVGDYLAYGAERHYGDLKETAEQLGKDQNTVSNWIAVCRAIPFPRRRGSLYFGHHEAVCAMPEHLQEKWLDIAENEGGKRLSVNALRKAIAQSQGHLDTPKPTRYERYEDTGRQLATDMVLRAQKASAQERADMYEYASEQMRIWSRVIGKIQSVNGEAQ